MTFDRDEQFLHEKLSADLHPPGGPVAWRWPKIYPQAAPPPSVAVPGRAAADCRRSGRQGAQFTDQREPRPSFAPDATAGHAISYAEAMIHPARRPVGRDAGKPYWKQLRMGPAPPGESCTDAFIPTTTISRTSTASRPRVRNPGLPWPKPPACRWRETAYWMQANPNPPAVVYPESPQTTAIGKKAPGPGRFYPRRQRSSRALSENGWISGRATREAAAMK